MSKVTPAERNEFPLKKGSKNTSVMLWQIYLRLKKVKVKKYPKSKKSTPRLIVADGDFGSVTERATRQFLNGTNTVSRDIFLAARTFVRNKFSSNTRSSAISEQDNWWQSIEDCESKFWFSENLASMAYATVIKLPAIVDPTKPIQSLEQSDPCLDADDEEHGDKESGKGITYSPPFITLETDPAVAQAAFAVMNDIAEAAFIEGEALLENQRVALGKHGQIAERLGIRKILSYYNKVTPARVPIAGKIETPDQMIESLDVFGHLSEKLGQEAYNLYKNVSVSHYFDDRPNVLRPHVFLVEMPEYLFDEHFEYQEFTYMRQTSITTGTLEEDPSYTPDQDPMRPRDMALNPPMNEALGIVDSEQALGPIRPCDAQGGCHVITFNNSNIGILDKVADILQEYHKPILEFKKNGSVRSIDILTEAQELRKFRKQLSKFLKLRNQGYHREGYPNGLDETVPFNLEIGLNTSFELSYILFDNGTETDLGIFSRMLSPCRVGMECFRNKLTSRTLGYVLYSRDIVRYWKSRGQKPDKWIEFVSNFTFPPVAIRPSNNKDDKWELCAYKANKYATKPVLSQEEKDERDEAYDNFDLEDENCKEKIASERENASESTQDSFFDDAGTFVVDELTGALEDIYEGVIDHIDIRTIIGEVYKCIAYHTGVPATAEAICEAAITWVLKESGVAEFLDTLFAVIPEEVKDTLVEAVEVTLLAGETFLGEPVGSSTGQPTIIGGMSIAVSDTGYTAEANLPGTGAGSEVPGSPGTNQTSTMGTTVYGVVTPVTNQIARDLNQIDNFIQKLKQMFDLRELCEKLIEAGMDFPADFLENPFFTEEGAAKYLEELKGRAPELPLPPTLSIPGGGGAAGSALNGNFYKQIRNSIVKAITEVLGEMIKTLIYKLLELCFKQENPSTPPGQNYGTVEMDEEFDRAGFGRQPPRRIFDNAGIPFDPSVASVLMQDIADMLTLSELCALLQGNVTNQLVANIMDLVRYNYGGLYAEALNTPAKVRSFFKDLGSLIDLQICEQVERLVPNLDDACESIAVYEDRCAEMAEKGIPFEVCQQQLKDQLRSNIAMLKNLALLLMGDNADILNEALKDKMHCGPGGIFPGLPPGIKLSNERALGTMFRHIKNMFTLELTAIRDRVMGFSSSDTAQATDAVDASLETEEWVGEIDPEGVLRGLSAGKLKEGHGSGPGWPRIDLWGISSYNTNLEEEDICLVDNLHPPFPDPCPKGASCSVRVKNGAWCLTDLLKVNLDHIHDPAGDGGSWYNKHKQIPGYRTYGVDFRTRDEDEAGVITRVFLPYTGDAIGSDGSTSLCDYAVKTWDPQYLRDEGLVVQMPKNAASDAFKATPGAFQKMAEMLGDDKTIHTNEEFLFFDVPAAKMPEMPAISPAALLPALGGTNLTADSFEQKWASFAQKMSEAKEAGLLNRYQFKYKILKDEKNFNSFIFQKTQIGINVDDSAVIEDFSAKEQIPIEYNALFVSEGLHRTDPVSGVDQSNTSSDSLPNALAEQILVKMEDYSRRFVGQEMFEDTQSLSERQGFKNWMSEKYYAEINEGYVEAFLDAIANSPMFRATSFDRIFNKIFPTEATCNADGGLIGDENPGLLNIPDIRKKIDEKLEEIMCREFYNPTRQRTPIKVDKVANKLVAPPADKALGDSRSKPKDYMGSSSDNETPPQHLRPVEEAALDGLIMTRIRLGIIQKAFEYLVMMPVFEMKAMIRSQFFMDYLYNFLLIGIDQESVAGDYPGNYREDIFARCQKIIKDRLGGGVGQTSYVDDHYHVYEIDEEGYGIAKSEHGHIHQIVDYRVLPSQELSLEALVRNNLTDLGNLPPNKTHHHIHGLQTIHRIPSGPQAFKMLVDEEFSNVFDIFDEVLKSNKLTDIAKEKISDASGIFNRLLNIGDIYELPAAGDAFVPNTGGAIPMHGGDVCAYAATEDGGGKFHNIPALQDNKIYDNFIFEPYIAIEHELESDGQPKLKTYLEQLTNKIADYESEGYESEIDDYQDLFQAKGIHIDAWFENGIWSVEQVNQLFGIIAGAEAKLEFVIPENIGYLTKDDFLALIEWKGIEAGQAPDEWRMDFSSYSGGGILLYKFEDLDLLKAAGTGTGGDTIEEVGDEISVHDYYSAQGDAELYTTMLKNANAALEAAQEDYDNIFDDMDHGMKMAIKQAYEDAQDAASEANANLRAANFKVKAYEAIFPAWQEYQEWLQLNTPDAFVTLADEQMLSVQIKDLFKCFSYGLRMSYVMPAETTSVYGEFGTPGGNDSPKISSYDEFRYQAGERLSDYGPVFDDGQLSFRTKAYLQEQYNNDMYTTSNDGYSYKKYLTLPLVDYEVPVWQFLKCKNSDVGGNENLRIMHLLNDSLNETFYGTPGSTKNTARNILYKRLFDSKEFKLMFEYIFPYSRTLSMMAMYVDAVGRETDMATNFSDTKAVIRNIINSLLHADAAFLSIPRGIKNRGGFEAMALANQPGTTVALPNMSDILKSILQQHPKLILKGLVELTDPCVKQALLILQGVQFLGNTGMDIAKRGFKTDKALTQRKLNKAKDRLTQIDNLILNHKNEITALQSQKDAAENENPAIVAAIESQIRDVLYKLYGSEDSTFQTGEPYTEETAPVGAFGGLVGEKAYINWKAEENEGQTLADIPLTPMPNYPKPIYRPIAGSPNEGNIERLQNKIENINEEIMNLEQEQIDLMDMGTPDKLPLTCMALRPSMVPYGFGFPPPLGTGPPLTMYGTIYLAMVAAGLYDSRDFKTIADTENMRSNNSSTSGDDEAC